MKIIQMKSVSGNIFVDTLQDPIVTNDPNSQQSSSPKLS